MMILKGNEWFLKRRLNKKSSKISLGGLYFLFRELLTDIVNVNCQLNYSTVNSFLKDSKTRPPL